MVLQPSACLAALLLLALAATASAQTAPAKPPAPHADPSDAKAAVPPMVYRSAFAKPPAPPAEVPLVPWQEANDVVWRIGGWRSYAREASQPLAPAPARGGPRGFGSQRPEEELRRR